MNKPFLKWAGGKYRLIPDLKKYFPEKCRKYIEPFLGAGSVALNMVDSAESIIVNDINADLMAVWSSLAQKGEEFIDLTRNSFPLDTWSKFDFEGYYYATREAFNKERSPHHFIYLNRHCYNGLCRYNKKGEFNVPYGGPRKYCFPEEELRAAIPLVKKMHFFNVNFNIPMMEAGDGDLIYCDPVYVPLNATANFVSYSREGFTHQHHHDLVAVAKLAVGRGATVIISNHDTEFTREIYRDAEIHPIEVKRSISCKGNNRTAAKEIIAVFSKQ
jgi:DNA adenine methylase